MELRFDLTGMLSRGKDDAPKASLSGDSLIIDCRGCEFIPLPGSKECIRCMVFSLCSVGGAGRIVMRTGRDIEVSGTAGRILRDVSSLKRWSVPAEPPKGRCRTCPVSRTAVVEEAWSRFPDPVLGMTAEEIVSSAPDREGCAECTATTVKTLDQISEGMSAIRRSMTESYRREVP